MAVKKPFGVARAAQIKKRQDNAYKVTGEFFINDQPYKWKEFRLVVYQQPYIKINGKSIMVSKHALKNPKYKDAEVRHEPMKLVRSVWESICPVCLEKFDIVTSIKFPFGAERVVRRCEAHRSREVVEIAEIKVQDVIATHDFIGWRHLTDLGMAVNKARETLASLVRQGLLFPHGDGYTKQPYSEEYAVTVFAMRLAGTLGMSAEEISFWFMSEDCPLPVKLAVWHDPMRKITANSVVVFLRKLVKKKVIQSRRKVYKVTNIYLDKKLEIAYD